MQIQIRNTGISPISQAYRPTYTRSLYRPSQEPWLQTAVKIAYNYYRPLTIFFCWNQEFII